MHLVFSGIPSAMILACQTKQLEMVRILLEFGAFKVAPDDSASMKNARQYTGKGSFFYCSSGSAP